MINIIRYIRMYVSTCVSFDTEYLYIVCEYEDFELCLCVCLLGAHVAAQTGGERPEEGRERHQEKPERVEEELEEL